MENQIKADSIDEIIKIAASLDPNTFIAVIESRGKYYLERGEAFIRSFEKMLYQGRAGSLEILN